MPKIIVNNFTDTSVGHMNVTFINQNGTVLGTFGANIATPAGNALDYELTGIPEGVYNETGKLLTRPHTSIELNVSNSQFDSAFNHAFSRYSATSIGNDDYDILNRNCVDFVNDVLSAAQQPSVADVLSIAIQPTGSWFQGTAAEIYAGWKDYMDDFWWTSWNQSLLNSDASFEMNAWEAYDAAQDLAADGPLLIDDEVLAAVEDFWANSWASPLVIYIDDDGISTTGVGDGVLFDITGDGALESTAWLTGGDGFLVFDSGGDGAITSSSEMFGGSHLGEAYDRLRLWDSNGDGQISDLDSGFADLQVWVDANIDGTTDIGELQSLAFHKIEAIGLDHDARLQQNGQNFTIGHSTALIEGEEVTVADVWFLHGSAPEFV